MRNVEEIIYKISHALILSIQNTKISNSTRATAINFDSRTQAKFSRVPGLVPIYAPFIFDTVKICAQIHETLHACSGDRPIMVAMGKDDRSIRR